MSKPISTKPIPFYIITMDFVLLLPPFQRFEHRDKLFDMIILITDKFTKAVKLFISKNTYMVTD